MSFPALNRKKWLWLTAFILLALLFTGLYSDEDPSQLYLRLMKADTSGNRDLDNAMRLLKTGLKSGVPIKTSDNFLQLLQNGKLTEAKTLLNGSYNTWENFSSENNTCENIVERGSNWQKCVIRLFSNQNWPNEYLQSHQDDIKHVYEISKIKSLNIDILQVLKPKLEKSFDTQMLFEDALGSVFIDREVNTLGPIALALSTSRDKAGCDTRLANIQNARMKLLASTNFTNILAATIVEGDLRLDTYNALLLVRPEQADCLISIASPNLESWRPNLYILRDLFRAGSSMFLKAIDDEISFGTVKGLNNPLMFKPQKSLNEYAELIQQHMDQSKSTFFHPFTPGSDFISPAQFRLRNWNNFTGQILLEISKPKFVDLQYDIALLLIKQQLTRAHAALILCRQSGQSDCQPTLNQYPDPFYQIKPQIMEQGKRIGYQFGAAQRNKRVSVPITTL